MDFVSFHTQKKGMKPNMFIISHILNPVCKIYPLRFIVAGLSRQNGTIS